MLQRQFFQDLHLSSGAVIAEPQSVAEIAGDSGGAALLMIKQNTTRGEMQTQSQPQNSLIYNDGLPARYASTMMGQSL